MLHQTLPIGDGFQALDLRPEHAALAGVDGLEFMPEAPYGRSTRWLSCIVVDPERFGAARERIRLHLESKRIESRPLWKPLHLQPIFSGCRVLGGSVSEDLFNRGLCLPSGSQLTKTQLRRIADQILASRG